MCTCLLIFSVCPACSYTPPPLLRYCMRVCLCVCVFINAPEIHRQCNFSPPWCLKASARLTLVLKQHLKDNVFNVPVVWSMWSDYKCHRNQYQMYGSLTAYYSLPNDNSSHRKANQDRFWFSQVQCILVSLLTTSPFSQLDCCKLRKEQSMVKWQTALQHDVLTKV